MLLRIGGRAVRWLESEIIELPVRLQGLYKGLWTDTGPSARNAVW